MTVYSFYIFDRHTKCIYSRHWIPKERLPAIRSESSAPAQKPPRRRSRANDGGDGDRSNNDDNNNSNNNNNNNNNSNTNSMPNNSNNDHDDDDDDDAKLIFGTVFSLRNMARKLGGPDDSLVGYSTSQYRLHFFETATNLRFVLLTDPNTPSMRTVLHQIYINLWVEHVVKNPLAPTEHKSGDGVRSELFEQVLDRLLGSIG